LHALLDAPSGAALAGGLAGVLMYRAHASLTGVASIESLWVASL